MGEIRILLYYGRNEKEICDYFVGSWAHWPSIWIFHRWNGQISAIKNLHFELLINVQKDSDFQLFASLLILHILYRPHTFSIKKVYFFVDGCFLYSEKILCHEMILFIFGRVIARVGTCTTLCMKDEKVVLS